METHFNPLLLNPSTKGGVRTTQSHDDSISGGKQKSTNSNKGVDLSDTGVITNSNHGNNSQGGSTANGGNQGGTSDPLQEDSFQRLYSKELDLDEDEVPIILHELNDSAIHFISRDQYERALSLLQKAQTLIDRLQFQKNPNDRLMVFLTMHNMALCFQKLGALEECALCLEASLQTLNSPFLSLKPNDEPAKKLKRLKYECKTHMQVCALLSQLHRHKEALVHAERSVQIAQYMVEDMNNMCLSYYQKVLIAKRNEQITQELLLSDPEAANGMDKDLIYYDDSISMLERTAYRVLPIVQEVSTKLIKPAESNFDNQTNQLAGEAALKIDTTKNTKLNMKSVLGYLNQSEWLYLLNIGNIMQITPMTVHDLYSNNSLEVELTRDSILEKISYLSVSFFCISTELRFLVQMTQKQQQTRMDSQGTSGTSVAINNQSGINADIESAKRKSESEFWHAKALDVAISFLPSECPLVTHIMTSYQKHHAPVQQQIPEDHETQQCIKVIRPLPGIDISKFQPIVRQDPTLNISLPPLPLSPNNYQAKPIIPQKQQSQQQIHLSNNNQLGSFSISPNNQQQRSETTSTLQQQVSHHSSQQTRSSKQQQHLLPKSYQIQQQQQFTNQSPLLQQNEQEQHLHVQQQKKQHSQSKDIHHISMSSEEEEEDDEGMQYGDEIEEVDSNVNNNSRIEYKKGSFLTNQSVLFHATHQHQESQEVQMIMKRNQKQHYQTTTTHVQNQQQQYQHHVKRAHSVGRMGNQQKQQKQFKTDHNLSQDDYGDEDHLFDEDAGGGGGSIDRRTDLIQQNMTMNDSQQQQHQRGKRPKTSSGIRGGEGNQRMVAPTGGGKKQRLQQANQSLRESSSNFRQQKQGGMKQPQFLHLDGEGGRKNLLNTNSSAERISPAHHAGTSVGGRGRHNQSMITHSTSSKHFKQVHADQNQQQPISNYKSQVQPVGGKVKSLTTAVSTTPMKPSSLVASGYQTQTHLSTYHHLQQNNPTRKDKRDQTPPPGASTFSQHNNILATAPTGLSRQQQSVDQLQQMRTNQSSQSDLVSSSGTRKRTAENNSRKLIKQAQQFTLDTTPPQQQPAKYQQAQHRSTSQGKLRKAITPGDAEVVPEQQQYIGNIGGQQNMVRSKSRGAGGKGSGTRSGNKEKIKIRSSEIMMVSAGGTAQMEDLRKRMLVMEQSSQQPTGTGGNSRRKTTFSLNSAVNTSGSQSHQNLEVLQKKPEGNWLTNAHQLLVLQQLQQQQHSNSMTNIPPQAINLPVGQGGSNIKVNTHQLIKKFLQERLQQPTLGGVGAHNFNTQQPTVTASNIPTKHHNVSMDGINSTSYPTSQLDPNYKLQLSRKILQQQQKLLQGSNQFVAQPPQQQQIKQSATPMEDLNQQPNNSYKQQLIQQMLNGGVGNGSVVGKSTPDPQQHQRATALMMQQQIQQQQQMNNNLIDQQLNTSSTQRGDDSVSSLIVVKSAKKKIQTKKQAAGNNQMTQQ